MQAMTASLISSVYSYLSSKHGDSFAIEALDRLLLILCRTKADFNPQVAATGRLTQAP